MKRARRILAAWLLCVLLTACAAQTGETAGLTVDILSTGKSDSILIRMDDLTVLLDAADADDTGTIRAALENGAVKCIDCLLLSHFDKDHIGAAAWVLENYPVARILSPDYPEDSEAYAALLRIAEEKAIPWERLHESVTLETENGTLTVDPPDEVYEDDNNNSLICELAYGEYALLFTGDALKKRLNSFLPEAAEHYDFIKLPHHGDDNKALTALLEATHPDYAAETIGADMAVESSLLQTLSRLGVQLYTTDRGAIRLTVSETGFSVVQP